MSLSVKNRRDGMFAIQMLHAYVLRLSRGIETFNNDMQAEEKRHQQARRSFNRRHKSLKLRIAKAMVRGDRLMHQVEQGALLETSKSTFDLIKRLLTPSEFAAVVEVRTRHMKAAIERKIAMQGAKHGKDKGTNVGRDPGTVDASVGPAAIHAGRDTAATTSDAAEPARDI